jgi:hypothetical protein
MEPCAKRRKRLAPAVVWRCVLFVARLRVRMRRKRSLKEVLDDMGMVQEPLRIRDIRDEAKELTPCWNPTPCVSKWCKRCYCYTNGATVRERLVQLTRNWRKGIVVVRTTTGLALLHDNQYDPLRTAVVDLLDALRRKNVDVEYIPPRYYTRKDHQECEEKNLLWVQRHRYQWSGVIAGIRLLNEEGRKQRQLKRTRAFAAELMARCWHPNGRLMQHLVACGR